MTINGDGFGGVLRRLRLAARLTQEELAARSGLNVRSVRYVERGQIRSPRPDTARLLGRALGLSGTDLDVFVAKARADYWADRDRENGATDGAEVAGPSSAADEGGRPGAPVRCLPRRIPAVAGRAAEIAQVMKVVADGDPAVVAIDGMAGVGKTTLAVEVAYRLAELGPDAQLYLDLQGHSERSPIEPVEAVGLLLRQLGVPPQGIPVALDERTALWRTELAKRRCLVLLDNAYDSGQVAPLLPAATGTVTLITSRRRLMGLDGVHCLSLGRLDPGEAVEMMARVAGDRVRVDAVAAAEVVALCGQLPLALCLAAARLVHRPSWTLADLVRRLRQAQRPLVALSAGGRSISAAFTLSYEQLPAAARRAFRLLGVHPAGTFDVQAAAAIGGLSVAEADDLVEQLVDVHMLDAPAAGRYRFHDLLRDFASSLLDDGGGSEREQAQRRMFDYYLHTTAAATADLDSKFGRRSVDFGVCSVETRSFAGRTDADAWLREHCLTVAALTEVARDAGAHRLVFLFAQAAWLYLYNHGPFSVATAVHERGLAGAEALQDDRLRAIASDRLASAYSQAGRWNDSLEMVQQSVALWRRCGDHTNLALSLANYAGVLGRKGRFAEVLSCLAEALALTGEREPIAAVPARRTLAVALRHLGRNEEALAENRLCIAAAKAAGNELYLARTLAELAFDHLALGHDRLTVLLLQRVCRLGSTTPYGIAESLSNLGTAYCRLGRLPEAMQTHQSAVKRMREFSEPASVALALNDLGATLLVAQRHTDAVDAHREALELAERSGARFEIARAHAGIGEALIAADPDEAIRHYRTAFALFNEMGTPQRHTVAERLADLTDTAPR